jgi:hypothetical protein
MGAILKRQLSACHFFFELAEDNHERNEKETMWARLRERLRPHYA